MRNDIKRDVLMVAGLGLVGAGLYFWFGAGPALTVDGVIITAAALLGRW